MPTAYPLESAKDEAEKAGRDSDGIYTCAAMTAREHGVRVCRRGSKCHCGRPVGPPVPVASTIVMRGKGPK
jgi:hypothetical protein